MASILILHDYRGQLYFSVREYAKGIELQKFAVELETLGHTVEVRAFEEVDVNRSYSGMYIFYQSSEDHLLFYKDFIEDVLLCLHLQGAVLLPRFELFRAHENKVFFEMLRLQSALPELKTLWSKWYSSFNDFEASDFRSWVYPVVVKPSSGSASRGVKLARNPVEMRRAARSSSTHISPYFAAKELGKRLLKRGYIPEALSRVKFIVQEYIPSLESDFKVLIYGERYYVLRRSIRSGDFRASGSGRFSFVSDPPVPVLNCAQAVYEYFDVPFISLDIAESEGKAYLIEAQFVRFGTYTLERSAGYFRRNEAGWVFVESEPDLENTMAQALTEYLSRSRSGA